jgi:arylsulfatase A-like enzyme
MPSRASAPQPQDQHQKRAEARTSAAASPRPSPLRAAFLLAIVLVAAKALLLEAPASLTWPLGVAAVSYRDVLFALILGAVGEALARAARSRPALACVVHSSVIALCALAALYSVIDVAVFQYFVRHLTYDLLRLVQDATAIRSSISERITLPLAVALIVVPIGYLAAALRNHPAGGASRAAAFTLAGFWIATGWSYSLMSYQDTRARCLAPNPHLELARSLALAALGTRRITFPSNFPWEDTLEFRPIAERGEDPGGFRPPDGVARPRNVIVIVLESVGTKYLSLYGRPYATTPNLDAESAHALVFDNMYAQASYTYFSFRAINFSIYPGLPWCYAPWAGRPMPPSLASVLRARGWSTAYLHNGDVDWGDERWLLKSDGFTDIEGVEDLGCPRLTSWGTEDRCLIDRLIEWIDQQRGRPFMAVCWTDQTHDPYRSSPGARPIDFLHGDASAPLAADLSKYLNVVHETDEQLGRLFAALRNRRLANDTLVVVTGDHGEAFRDPHDERGHGLAVYEEEVHVPLMIWNPRLFRIGRRVATVGGHVDLSPTIADILGVKPLGGWQGFSLFDPERPPHAFFLSNVGDYLFGVRDGSWKYIYDATGGPEMLFDLGRDRDERHNLAAADPERCRELRLRIAGWVSFEESFLRGKELVPPPSRSARAGEP